MKSLKFKIGIIGLFFILFTKQATAQDYIKIKVDSLNNNDTIIYCSEDKYFKIFPYDGASNIMWIVNDWSDTIQMDTLILSNNYKGSVCIQSSIDIISFYISPFAVLNNGSNKTITCGDEIQLDIHVLKNLGNDLAYHWSPSDGLSDTTLSNPLASVKNDTKYKVTVTASGGCMAVDSINISIQKMDSPSICIVGVDSTNKNLIVWDKPASSSIDSFYIYKETNVTNVYEKIGAVDYDEPSLFRDASSFPAIQSNAYKISLKDNCGMETDKSPEHKPMHLSINQGQNNTWNLIWEPYSGFTVSTYYIYRGTSQTNLQLIGSTSAISTQYSDFSAPAGYVYYQVEVIGPNACDPLKSSPNNLKSASYNSSRSNIATNNPLGLKSFDELKFFSIYPNPANNEFIIESKAYGTSKGIVEITNLNGKLLKKVLIHSNKTIINIENLHNGIYTIKITSEKGTLIQKLIKR